MSIVLKENNVSAVFDKEHKPTRSRVCASVHFTVVAMAKSQAHSDFKSFTNPQELICAVFNKVGIKLNMDDLNRSLSILNPVVKVEAVETVAKIPVLPVAKVEAVAKIPVLAVADNTPVALNVSVMAYIKTASELGMALFDIKEELIKSGNSLSFSETHIQAFDNANK